MGNDEKGAWRQLWNTFFGKTAALVEELGWDLCARCFDSLWS